MKPYLELNCVRKFYPTATGRAVIVEDFDLFVEKGEFVCLIGHSGCGKSTVLSMVAGLNELSSGGIVLAGHDVDGPGPDRGVVFQSPCLLPWMTARENVRLGIGQVMKEATLDEQNSVAAHYLELVGLGNAVDRKPGEMSQGMCQRVGLARAFALSPDLLLLDEPFGMLDSITRLELQNVLIDLWQKDRKTALMVTHDVDEALFLSDRIVMMTSGPAARVGRILDAPFPRPRTRAEVLDHPEYFRCREELIGFLENEDSRQRVKTPA